MFVASSLTPTFRTTAIALFDYLATDNNNDFHGLPILPVEDGTVATINQLGIGLNATQSNSFGNRIQHSY